MWSSLNEWFWSEKFWLQPNATWANLEDCDGQVYPHPRDLLVTFPMALALLVLRFAFERFIALPLGHWLGVQNQLRQQAKPIPELERHFFTVGPKLNEMKNVRRDVEESDSNNGKVVKKNTSFQHEVAHRSVVTTTDWPQCQAAVYLDKGHK